MRSCYNRDMPAQVTVTRFGPGEEAHDYQSGDFILTHNLDFYGWLIRFGQRLRYWGADRKFAHWNHAALIISPEGELIEALSRGVVRTHISNYAGTEYHLVRLSDEFADARDRAQMVAFALSCWREPYGWLTIVNIAIALVTGCTFTFGIEGQSICSGLVAKALERSNAIFHGNSANVTPAALAKLFNVPVPAYADIGAPPFARRGALPPTTVPAMPDTEGAASA